MLLCMVASGGDFNPRPSGHNRLSLPFVTLADPRSAKLLSSRFVHRLILTYESFTPFLQPLRAWMFGWTAQKTTATTSIQTPAAVLCLDTALKCRSYDSAGHPDIVESLRWLFSLWCGYVADFIRNCKYVMRSFMNWRTQTTTDSSKRENLNPHFSCWGLLISAMRRYFFI